MKSFTDRFIRRPVLALVVSFVILLAGAQAILPVVFPTLKGLGGLNVRQYPRSDIASVTINTVYVGADAELVRGFITTPLERAIAAADGIDYIQSQSTQGSSLITVRLKLNCGAKHQPGSSPQRAFAQQLSCCHWEHERVAPAGESHCEY